MGEWINGMCVCSGILFSLKKEILTHATIWVNFEDVLLIEMSQKRTNIVRFYLNEPPKVVKFIEMERNDSGQKFAGGLGS